MRMRWRLWPRLERNPYLCVLAEHPKTPKAWLEALGEGRYWRGVVLNPEAPADLLRRIVAQRGKEALEIGLDNPNLPEDLVLEGKEHFPRAYAHPNFPREVMEGLDPLKVPWILAHPHFPITEAWEVLEGLSGKDEEKWRKALFLVLGNHPGIRGFWSEKVAERVEEALEWGMPWPLVGDPHTPLPLRVRWITGSLEAMPLFEIPWTLRRLTPGEVREVLEGVYLHWPPFGSKGLRRTLEGVRKVLALPLREVMAGVALGFYDGSLGAYRLRHEALGPEEVEVLLQGREGRRLLLADPGMDLFRLFVLLEDPPEGMEDHPLYRLLQMREVSP